MFHAKHYVHGDIRESNMTTHMKSSALVCCTLILKMQSEKGMGIVFYLMWKYFLPIYKATGHKNYALEALTILSQYATLPPNLAEQLKCSRFINTPGLVNQERI